MLQMKHNTHHILYGWCVRGLQEYFVGSWRRGWPLTDVVASDFAIFYFTAGQSTQLISNRDGRDFALLDITKQRSQSSIYNVQ